MNATPTPRTMRLTWWPLAAWLLPALAWQLTTLTWVRWRTGEAADAVGRYANEPASIILYFVVGPAAIWALGAIAYVGVSLARGERVAPALWSMLAVTVVAIGLSRIPSRAWDAITLRAAGPGQMAGPVIEDAMERNDTTRAAWLITHGAPVDAPGGGDTPLMLASGWGSQRWLSFLFAHGANPNASNSYGETPLFRAIASNRVTATEALLAHGAKVGDAMRIAVNVGDTTIIRILGAHR